MEEGDFPTVTVQDPLRRFADQTKDMIFRCRIAPTRKWEYLSPSCFQLTGYTVDEHFADPMLVFKVVHPDDVHLYDAVIKYPERNHRPIIVRWIRKDGTQLWVEEQVQFLRDDQGVAVAVEGIARDIPERRRIEEQLAEAQRIAHIGNWVWAIGSDEVSWSEELSRIHGISPDAAPRTFAAFVETFAREDRQRASELLRGSLNDPRPFDFE